MYLKSIIGKMKMPMAVAVLCYSGLLFGAKPELEDQFFGKKIKYGEVEVSVLPNGTIGGGAYKGAMLWERVFCVLCTGEWQSLACTANPLEKIEEPRCSSKTIKDGVQTISSGLMGDPKGGRWRYVQTMTMKADGQLELRFNLKPVVAPKKPVLYIMIKMEMPVNTYAKAPISVCGPDGKISNFPEFGCMCQAQSFTLSRPEPGWTVKLGPGIGQAHLSNCGWGCVATLSMVIYNFNRPVEVGVTYDFSGLTNK